MRLPIRFLAVAFLGGLSTAANAFFFIIPLPNLAKPPALSKLIDALENSTQTKAVAYASEDKTFGAKHWVWGHWVGRATQEEANNAALSACEASLTNAKGQRVGGEPLYGFGNKRCELHEFTNRTVMLADPPIREAVSKPPSVVVPDQTTTKPAEASSVSPQALSTATSQQTDARITPQSTASQGGQAAAAGTSSTGDDSAVARRLRALLELREKGLISEEEYQSRRRSILDAL